MYKSHISVAGDKETQPLNLSLSKIKSQGTLVSTYFLVSHFEDSAWSVVTIYVVKSRSTKYLLSWFTGLQTMVIEKNMNKTQEQHSIPSLSAKQSGMQNVFEQRGLNWQHMSPQVSYWDKILLS